MVEGGVDGLLGSVVVFQFQVELSQVCAEELLALRLQSSLVEANRLERWRGRDGEMERWRDGEMEGREMERWRDGGMERWRGERWRDGGGRDGERVGLTTMTQTTRVSLPAVTHLGVVVCLHQCLSHSGSQHTVSRIPLQRTLIHLQSELRLWGMQHINTHSQQHINTVSSRQRLTTDTVQSSKFPKMETSRSTLAHLLYVHVGVSQKEGGRRSRNLLSQLLEAGDVESLVLEVCEEDGGHLLLGLDVVGLVFCDGLEQRQSVIRVASFYGQVCIGYGDPVSTHRKCIHVFTVWYNRCPVLYIICNYYISTCR